MPQKKLEQSELKAICSDFNMEFRGMPVTIDVLPTRDLAAPGRGAYGAIADPRAIKTIARHTPLHAVRLLDGKGRPFVKVVYGAGEKRVHVVRPREVLLVRTSQGQNRGLRLDGVDARTTLLRFRTTPLAYTNAIRTKGRIA